METDFMYFNPWDILIFMFIGLAFFKMGLMQGDHPMKTYLIIAVAGLGIGSRFVVPETETPDRNAVQLL